MTQLNATKTLVTAIGLLLLAPVGVLQAQTDQRFHVPFDFSVQDKTFEHGKYIVRIDETAGRIELRLPDGETTLMLFGSPTYRPALALTGTLVFHKYGDRYFLRKVWMNGRAWGREVPLSRVERETAISAAMTRGAEVALRTASR